MRTFKPLFCLLVFLPLNLTAMDVRTDFTGDKYYRTVGIFEAAVDFDTVSGVLTDFGSYGTWALKGLDGKEPGTENLIGLLTDAVYHGEEDEMEILYDVRLPWPLGSAGNSVLFLISDMKQGSRELTFRMEMTGSSAALRNAVLEVLVLSEERGCRIEGTAKIRFSGFLNLFFTLPAYRKTIEWRIVRILSNMESYIECFVLKGAVLDGS